MQIFVPSPSGTFDATGPASYNVSSMTKHSTAPLHPIDDIRSSITGWPHILVMLTKWERSL